jgi:hypothetical protein
LVNCSRSSAGPGRAGAVWINRIERTRAHPARCFILATRQSMKPLPGTVPAEAADVIDDRRRNPDRRAAPRKRILRAGLTGWQNGDSGECIVHNLSDTGAHLQIRGPVPRTFNLVIDGDGVSRSCCVIWRNANRVGVKFEGQFAIVGLVSSYKQHANQCRILADRVASLDRETLLKMAEAWEALTRSSQKNFRSAGRASF